MHYEEIQVVVLTESALALKVLVEGREVWVPKSVVELDESEALKPGERGSLVVKGWFAEKEELV